jgi:hypothetical protein
VVGTWTTVVLRNLMYAPLVPQMLVRISRLGVQMELPVGHELYSAPDSSSAVVLLRQDPASIAVPVDAGHRRCDPIPEFVTVVQAPLNGLCCSACCDTHCMQHASSPPSDCADMENSVSGDLPEYWLRVSPLPQSRQHEFLAERGQPSATVIRLL